MQKRINSIFSSSFRLWLALPFFYCKISEKERLWFELPVQNPFHLNYDPEARENPRSIPVRILTLDSRTCLQSGEVPGYAFTFCLSDADRSINSTWENSIEAWRRKEISPERTVYDSVDRNISASIGTFKINEVRKRIVKSGFGILGSGELKKDSSDGMFWDRRRYVRKFHEPGFSLFRLEGNEWFWVFPPSESSGVYLTLKILLPPGLDSDWTNRLGSIPSTNEKILANCKADLPEISEIFGETESVSGRWIELYNPYPHPICEFGLQFVLFGNRVSLPASVGFFAPGESKVYAEESSILEKILLTGIRWGDLKRNGTLQLTKEGSVSERVLPGGGYRFGEESYSWKRSGFSDCGAPERTSFLPESYCMDPGRPSERFASDDRRIGLCDAREFRIEEINFLGAYRDGKLRPDYKFIDLEYTGLTKCDSSDLELSFGSTNLPISARSLLQPGAILTVGAIPFLFGKAELSYRNLSNLKGTDSIRIRNRTSGSEKNLWNGEFRGPESAYDRVALEIPGTATSSLLVREEKVYIPKKELPPDGLHPSHRFFPGRKTEFDFSGSATISEVSWAGSYRGNEPISGDRFLEVRSENQEVSSAVLQTQTSGGGISSILFPIEKGWSLLSSGKLTCFPNSVSWTESNFSLPQTGGNVLRLLDPIRGGVWGEFRYTSAGPGKNDTRGKIRRSAFFLLEQGGTEIWKDSDLPIFPGRSEGCEGTHASPGAPNAFPAEVG
ncbi:hypothetical protein EHO60_00220 [Leptospira fletcheri]|uniref:Lamin tail domain-containing protein n=1 Tax=Leptospira fletcheri TaxID=2484981 RepID=A0A4R9GJG9_9LEPT|nr:hypothetical protein [Leptospira fletcheri]TGK13820.1 hypothetical protein EHO60_00220 [Leptospira fletcheri]